MITTHTRLALTGPTGCAVLLSLALLHARLAAPTQIGQAAAPTAQSGAPGTLITDTLRVTNTGAATEATR